MPVAQDGWVEVGVRVEFVCEPIEINRNLSQPRHRVLRRHRRIVERRERAVPLLAQSDSATALGHGVSGGQLQTVVVDELADVAVEAVGPRIVGCARSERLVSRCVECLRIADRRTDVEVVGPGRADPAQAYVVGRYSGCHDRHGELVEFEGPAGPRASQPCESCCCGLRADRPPRGRPGFASACSRQEVGREVARVSAPVVAVFEIRSHAVHKAVEPAPRELAFEHHAGMIGPRDTGRSRCRHEDPRMTADRARAVSVREPDPWGELADHAVDGLQPARPLPAVVKTEHWKVNRRPRPRILTARVRIRLGACRRHARHDHLMARPIRIDPP